MLFRSGSCADRATLDGLFAAGMTGARLNLSHTTLPQCAPLLEDIYWPAARACGRAAHLIIDLQGPELRVGTLTAPVALESGSRTVLGPGGIPIPTAALEAAQPGDRISLDDSALLVQVEEKRPNGLFCRVERGGQLQSRKSLAILGREVHTPTLTQADLDNLAQAKRFGVTHILQPFVRGVEDVHTLRRAMAEAGLEHGKIMAKIENQRGLEKLDEIIDSADIVCIARGDLGNSMPLWQLPSAQKHIARACRSAGKPFFVVTQLLWSMQQRATLYRAKTSSSSASCSAKVAPRRSMTSRVQSTSPTFSKTQMTNRSRRRPMSTPIKHGPPQGPQCVEGSGDWMARSMYMEGTREYEYHVKHYGHPSEVGFKDIIPLWKAENWDPDKLVAFYKKIGAQYFFALGNHHDNMDLWDSKYQPWNSVNMGPKKDILAGWEKAARKYGLYFGVSLHADHAWSWYEPSQRHDTKGPKKGIPYDGKLTKADGKGKWWEGYDPQDLYAQNHPLSENSWDNGMIHRQWAWGNGVCVPSQEYCTNFYNRTLDVINRYNPDLLYFDVTVAPFYPVSDAGLKIAAHFYNHNMATHKGKLEAVMFGKILDENQRKALVWDVERGAPNKIIDQPWQSCSCIGGWHYNTSIYEKNEYKSAAYAPSSITINPKVVIGNASKTFVLSVL